MLRSDQSTKRSTPSEDHFMPLRGSESSGAHRLARSSHVPNPEDAPLRTAGVFPRRLNRSNQNRKEAPNLGTSKALTDDTSNTCLSTSVCDIYFIKCIRPSRRLECWLAKAKRMASCGVLSFWIHSAPWRDLNSRDFTALLQVRHL